MNYLYYVSNIINIISILLLEAIFMNKFALIVVILFTLIELMIGEVVVCGIPLWVVGLIVFSFVWMGIIYIKDEVKIKGVY